MKTDMTYQDLGFNDTLAQYRQQHGLDAFMTGRVIAEHKERYTIKTPEAEFDAELVGSLRFGAIDRYDLPAVGDWVAFTEFDEGRALIHHVFPRNSIVERKAAGARGKVQIIATNIDVGLIVQGMDRDFNINRLERYVTICHTSRIRSIVVLSKIDLISPEELNTRIQAVKNRLNAVTVVAVSMHTHEKYAGLTPLIERGQTYCLLGSSGAGKSTLLNHILGNDHMATGEISSSVNKGKHTTSHRELILIENGGILIDNPGMREVGLTDLADGLETTFEDILDYAYSCKFRDCTHSFEKGCAILKAVENGEIHEDSYANFQKMQLEKQHFESSFLERKKKDKDLGKLIKNMKKQRKGNKY